MKIIKVSTDLKLTVHEFLAGSHTEQNRFLRGLIGNDCDLYEHVVPKRLYTELHMTDRPTNVPGQCVSMLVDEEGLLKNSEPNPVGSYLYETDIHGSPIMGNVLFVGEEWGRDGVDFCGIEDSVFKELESQLRDMVLMLERVKEGTHR